jgi:hypothetical protein
MTETTKHRTKFPKTTFEDLDNKIPIEINSGVVVIKKYDKDNREYYSQIPLGDVIKAIEEYCDKNFIKYEPEK